jgi:hypothetical protein
MIGGYIRKSCHSDQMLWSEPATFQFLAVLKCRQRTSANLPKADLRAKRKIDLSSCYAGARMLAAIVSEASR